jgi:hypothetical protein
VTGFTESTNFPTVNPIQGSLTNVAGSISYAFLAELNFNSSTATLTLVYSTYLGGSPDNASEAVAIDSSGNAYLAGYTGSTAFPTANPLQATNKTGGGVGGITAFVAKISPVTIPPALSFTAPVVYFSAGSLGFGGQSGTLPLTVSNLGQASLSLVSATPSGTPFSIAQIACTNGASSLPITLPSGGACVFSVSYAAPVSGTASGTLVFVDNAPWSNLGNTASASNFTQSLPLTGAGASAPPPPPPSNTVSVPVNETITAVDTPVVAATLPCWPWTPRWRSTPMGVSISGTRRGPSR